MSKKFSEHQLLYVPLVFWAQSIYNPLNRWQFDHFTAEQKRLVLTHDKFLKKNENDNPPPCLTMSESLTVVRQLEPIDNYVYVANDSLYANKLIHLGLYPYQCLGLNLDQRSSNKHVIRLNLIQRSEIKCKLDENISPTFFNDPDIQIQTTGNLEFLVIIHQNKRQCIYESEVLDLILMNFKDLIIFPGRRQYVLKYDEITLLLTNLSNQYFKINPKLTISLVKAPNSELTIIKNSINDFRNFSRKSMEELGIGGLQHEYEEILRRIFNSRLVDKKLMDELGLKHVKGAILYGPAGTGKTLLSKKFSSLIGNIDPIVVNGPEILNKYVGQSEENIRKLFEPARKNPNQVSVIIFDEIDAICKERGRSSNGPASTDGIVNQLLAMMDGVNSLENILVIGITNRMELLDSALLRPGRFEVHLRIGLPNIKGRYEIFNIYLKAFYESKRLLIESSYEDYLTHLSKITHNYSGAEINGVVRSATSFALNREIDWDDQKKEIVKTVSLTNEDIMRGVDEVKPQWSGCQGGLPARWEDHPIDNDIIQQMSSALINKQKILLHGAVKSGKTQYLVALSEIIPDANYILYINKDLERALDNLETVAPDYIFIDDILDLIGFVSLGCRYQTSTVLRLRTLLKGTLPIIATVNSIDILSEFGLIDQFDLQINLDTLYRRWEPLK